MDKILIDEKIQEKLDEYRRLLDFSNEYLRKDFKNNFKFITWAVKKMIKNKVDNKEIVQFLQSTIDIHKKSY